MEKREIKFRAIVPVNSDGPKEMHYFDLSKIDDCSRLSYADYDADQLMQFTGLKDKNGVEIYEGDIVNIGHFALNDTSKFGKDCWKNLPDGVNGNDLSTIIKTEKVSFDPKSLFWLYEVIRDNPDVIGVEVIGNIYQNPDLLPSNLAIDKNTK